MNWFTGIATYIVLWWITIFAVLPWGVKPAEEGDLGHAAGAPSNPRIWLKVGMTTIVAGILWLFVYWFVNSGLISMRS